MEDFLGYEDANYGPPDMGHQSLKPGEAP